MRRTLLIGALLTVMTTGCLKGEGADFTAQALGATISPGGRWQVTIRVTNNGNPGTPDCDIRAIDADGIQLAVDSVTLDKLGTDRTVTVQVLTGLRPGENEVRRWRVECN